MKDSARKLRRRRVAIATPVAVILIAGGVFGATQVGAASAADRYVTATATTGKLEQTLSGTGTVSPVSSASVSFPASATVTGVFAKVGDQVTIGQVLATIDPTRLQYAVDQDTLALAQAQSKLVDAETASTPSTSASSASTSKSAASSTSSSSPSPSSSASPSPSSSPSPSASLTPSSGPTNGSASAQLDKIKADVAAAQSALNRAWQTFTVSLTSTTTTCSATPTASPTPAAPASSAAKTGTPPEGATTTPTESASATPSATPSPTDTPTPTTAGRLAAAKPTHPGGTSDQCVSALEGTGSAEASVTEAKDALSSAVSSLVTLAESALASSGSGTAGTGTTGASSGSASTGTSTTSSSSHTSSSGSASSTTSTSGSSSGGSSGGGAGGGGSTTTVGQAEAGVASAKLDLTNDQLALSKASLVAPLTGTLTALPWAVGDTASTSDVATVSGSKTVEMTIQVAQTSVTKVKVGQPVVVTATTGTSSSGTVSAIAMLPASSTSSTVTYPVTIVVDDPQAGLTGGTTATAVVTVASSDGAVLVPLSAITLTATSAGTVTVLGSDNTTTTEQVTLGVVGATSAQIATGITAGTKVVLADTTSVIPASTTSNRAASSFTGGGNFAGAGARPGG